MYLLFSLTNSDLRCRSFRLKREQSHKIRYPPIFPVGFGSYSYLSANYCEASFPLNLSLVA